MELWWQTLVATARSMSMERRLFGTDGIRGLANTHPMTAEVALALGKAAGRRVPAAAIIATAW